FALEPPQHWLCSEERRGAPRPGDQPGRARQHARGWRSGRDQKSSKPPHGPEGDKKREPEAEGAESEDHAARFRRLPLGLSGSKSGGTTFSSARTTRSVGFQPGLPKRRKVLSKGRSAFSAIFTLLSFSRS